MAAHELVVDSFAGGGGASLGIEQAIGRPVDIAINHKPEAIAMHAANHPHTKHFTEDVFKVSPTKVTGGRPVGLLWMSPDCKHFSRAKGGEPVSERVRGLAWVAVTWAKTVRPRVIILENVREFQEWGPLLPRWACQACQWKGTEGQVVLKRKRLRCPRCESLRVCVTEDKVPDPARKGVTFRQFVGRLKAQGYAVEWRVLNAADYGAPTHRRRLFLVARCDGEPIVWPEPTHGDPAKIRGGLFDGDLKPWRTAAECIDWSLPCPSIFMTRAEARAWGKANGCAAPQRPLAEATLKRIALGVKRYVLENPKPFIVTNTTGNPPCGADEPLKTVTTGNHHYLCTPLVARTDMHQSNAGCVFPPQEPLRTVTTTGGFAVVAPVLAHMTHAGERRSHSPTEPLPTVTGAHRGEMAVVAPVLAHLAHGDGKDGKDRGQRGSSVDSPVNVIHAGGNNFALVSAFLAKHYGGVVGHGPERPLGTITTTDHHSVVAANLVHMNNHTGPSACDEPAKTVTAGGNHAALVYSFLTQYNGTSVGTSLHDPLNTQSTRDRFGLVECVTVNIDGQVYAIVDIGLRMLRPMELALCQGFPRTVKLIGTAGEQVERIGNSVSPYVARAMAAANFRPVGKAVAA